MKDKIRNYWRAIGATFLGIGVYLAAVLSHQPEVPVQSAPEIQPVSASEYRVTSDYVTTISNFCVRVRAGYVFDGASIPPGLTTALGLNPFSGTLLRGALVHDALYASELVSKDTADNLFYQAILADGTEQGKAAACHRAVRDWGFRAFERHTYESINAARTFVEVASTP